MNDSIRKYLDVLNEIRDEDPENYKKLITQQFQNKVNINDFSVHTQASIDMVKLLYNDVVEKTMSSDSGNFIAQWLENNEYVFIVGITSKNEKIKKEDLVDVYEFIHLLIERLTQGKQIVTTPNKRSIKLLDKMFKIMKKHGISVDFQKQEIGNVLGGDTNDPLLHFYSVIIKAKR